MELKVDDERAKRRGVWRIVRDYFKPMLNPRRAAKELAEECRALREADRDKGILQFGRGLPDVGMTLTRSAIDTASGFSELAYRHTIDLAIAKAIAAGRTSVTREDVLAVAPDALSGLAALAGAGRDGAGEGR